MPTSISDRLIFILKVRTPAGQRYARLLIDSLRSFGGEMSSCPVWLFAVDPGKAPCDELKAPGVQVIPLELPQSIVDYILGDKVYVCAHAERLAPAGVQSLVWMDLSCLVVQPPRLFDLGEAFDAALRPVHIRNVGLTLAEPLDDFWRTIYQVVGVQDILTAVESFVDDQVLRAYFNTHAFSVNPSRGLLCGWLEYFERLVGDPGFQNGPCQDERHQVFLHQAVLSALLAARLPPERLRILPPTYNYPYNLQGSIPPEKRVSLLNDLTCLTYEDRSIHPDAMTDIQVLEPLRTWLTAFPHP